MPTVAKLFLGVGALSGALAVILGAFGAHAVRDRLSPQMMSVFETATQYHFYHSLALLAVGVVAIHLPGSLWIKLAGGLFLAGIVIFSGTLYGLSLSGVRWLGAITPLGGLSLIVGWLVLAVGVWRSG